MGAIETLSKLAGLTSSIESGRRQDIKYIRAQQQAQRKQQLDSLKYITGRYTDLFFSAKGNRALQENILQTMQGMKGSLPPAFRQQFELFTKAGPFSEVAEKRRKWLDIKGPPPRELTTEERQDKSLVVEHGFRVKDYNYEMEHFLTGKAPMTKPRMIGLEGGDVAVRGDDGVIHLTTDTMLAGKALADELGQNFGSMLANQFRIPGEKRTYVSGGQEVTIQKSYDALSKKSTVEPVASKKVSEKAHWESSLLTEVLAKIVTGRKSSIFDETDKSVGGRIANRALAYIDKFGGESLVGAEKALNESIRGIPEFQNIYLAVTDELFDVDSWYEWSYGLSEFARIIPIYGDMTPFQTRDAKEIIFIWDKQIDVVHSADGQRLGSYDEAISYASQQDQSFFLGKER